jgi:hypothetical protein
MINSPIAALATGLMASQRLENVPSAEPFRNNFFVSSLLCGNAAAQLVFNMRTADELAEVLKSRAAIEAKLKIALDEKAKLNGDFTAKTDELAEVQKSLAATADNLKIALDEKAKLNKDFTAKTDELAEVLKAGATSADENKTLKSEKEKLSADLTQLTAARDRLLELLVVLEHPKIPSQAIVGQKLTAAWGVYEGSQKDAPKTRSWVVAGKPPENGDEFTPDGKDTGKEVILREEFPTPKGKVTVESKPMTITKV